MKHFMRGRALGVLAVALLGLGTGCETPLGVSGVPESGVEPGGDLALTTDKGVARFAVGGGHYLLSGTFDVQFALVAAARSNGHAAGRFHQRLVADGLVIDFDGEVTCMSVDPANGRAWIGGVILRNRSTDPAFQTAIHQPGRDIWFRVLDEGNADRLTFLGFEGSGGIITSEEYCATMPWPDGNARTHPVTSGNIVVHP
jgi:hypothetical protein